MSLWIATRESHSFSESPSLAKLMPRAGSGSSGGTSSAGKLTSHCSFGNPYKQRFSFSDYHRKTNNSESNYHMRVRIGKKIEQKRNPNQGRIAGKTLAHL